MMMIPILRAPLKERNSMFVYKLLYKFADLLDTKHGFNTFQSLDCSPRSQDCCTFLVLPR